MSPFHKIVLIFAVSTLSWQPDLICTLLKNVFRVENLRQDNMSLFPLCHITFKNVVCLFTDDLFASRHWQLRPYLRSHRLFSPSFTYLCSQWPTCVTSSSCPAFITWTLLGFVLETARDFVLSKIAWDQWLWYHVVCTINNQWQFQIGDFSFFTSLTCKKFRSRKYEDYWLCMHHSSGKVDAERP